MKPGYALAALFVAHLILASLLVSPGVLFGGEPIASLDYSLHFARVWATDEMLGEHGRIWGYNPFFLAGYPAGTVFDVNNHFIELFGVALHRVGVSLPTAFNLFVFLALVLVPVFTWTAARNFDLSPWQQVTAVALAMLLWFTDGEVRVAWRVGVIASGVAMYALPYALSCLHRYMERRTATSLAAFLVTGALVSLLHPLSFLFFFGMVALYLVVRAPRFDLRFWGAMVLFAVLVLAINMIWIAPLLQHLSLKTTSGYHWIGDLRALARDLALTRGSGLRLLLYAFGVGGLVVWWREGRRNLAELIGVPVVLLTGFGYLAGHLEIFLDFETYRNNLVVSFLLVSPAATAFDRALGWLRTLAPPKRRGVAVAGALLVLVLLVKNLLFFAPYARGQFGRHALSPLHPADMKVVELVRERVGSDERVLVEYWPLGAMLPWYTGREVIGGPYPLVWMPHNFANFVVYREVSVARQTELFGQSTAEITPEEVRIYLEQYGIGWIVASSDETKALFDTVATVSRVEDLGRNRVYRLDAPTGLTARGTATVEGRFGSLVLRDVAPGEVVLRYHWSPTLVSEPPQAVLPCSMPGDPVPFIFLPDARDGVLLDRGTTAAALGDEPFRVTLPTDAPACPVTTSSGTSSL
jgi:hypothetical protein